MVHPDAVRNIVLAHSTINGCYESVQPLNADGQFSVVFQARSLTNGDLAALKFFAQTLADPYRQLCFEREGRLLWGPLRGEPRFVQLIEAPASLPFSAPLPNGGQLALDLPFLALEWMNGGDATRLTKTAPQTHRDTLLRLECFREMVRAVHRLHNLGCHHRDLKPGNFLLANTPSGRLVKLSDFGTTRLCDGSPPLLPAYQQPVGDLRYSAPELFSAVDVPNEWYRAADVYSLGSILFELMTAQQFAVFTFRGFGDLRQLHRHMTTVPLQNRLLVYDGVVRTAKLTIPSLGAINAMLPRCALPVLDELLGEMTALNYRTRTITFDRVLRLVDIARLVVANETKYKERIGRR